MAITLFGCYDLKGSYNSSALININKYKAFQVAITRNQTISSYLDSIYDVKISSFRFSTYNLSSWLYNSNFIYEGHQKYRAGKNIYVKYRLPKQDKGVKLKSGIRLRIVTVPTISGLSNAETQRSIIEENFIELSRKNLKINESLYAMDKLLDFLTIGVGEAQSPNNVSFVYNKIRYKFFFSTAKNGSNKNVYPQHMFFSYRHIMPQWNNIINRWYDTYDDMIDIFRLFFSLFSKSSIYLNQRFLLLVQFLESFHRKAYPMDDTKIDEWRKILDTAFSSEITEKVKKDLISKLKYGYEPSLESRLNSLFKCSTLPLITKGNFKFTIFSKKVAETRNYLTHHGHKTVNVIDDNKDLIQACIVLDKLSRYCILNTMGLSDIQMAEIVKNFSRLDMKVMSL